MKLLRAKIWWLLAAVILAFTAFLAWERRMPADVTQRLAKLRAEGIPITLAELDAWYPAVTNGENAALLLLDAASLFRANRDTNLPVVGSAKEPPRGQPWPAALLTDAQSHLAANAEGLGKLKAALAHPQARYPLDQKQDFKVTTPVGLLKMAAGELSLQARMAAENGKPAEAAQCLREQITLARTLEGVPTIISHLIQLSMEHSAIDSAERVLSRTSLSESDLETLQRTYAEAAASLSYERAIVGEQCFLVDQLRLPAADTMRQMGAIALPSKLKGSMFDDAHVYEAFTWLYCVNGMRTRDLRVGLDYLDGLRTSARLPVSRQRATIRRLDEELEQLMSGHYLPYVEMLMSALGKGVVKDVRHHALLRSVETALALERWRLAHDGALPATLNELVPQFLSAVPEDPLDGKPLKYRTLSPGYVVYSIGEDETDDGGKERMPGSGQTKGWDDTFTVAR